MVIATGYVYGHAAGAVATVVKLTRTLLLVPLAIAVRLRYAKADGSVADAPAGIGRRALRVMPWFVFGFVAMALLNSLGAILQPAAAPLSKLAGFLIAMVPVRDPSLDKALKATMEPLMRARRHGELAPTRALDRGAFLEVSCGEPRMSALRRVQWPVEVRE